MSNLKGYCSIDGCERPRLSGLDVCFSHNKAKNDEGKLEIKKPFKPLQRGSTPKKVSDKRAEQNERYNKRVKEWLIGKKCAVYPHLDATQCHHRAGRQNELLEDETYWLPVSDEGHKFIHANSEWSREKGFMLLRSVTEKPTI